MYCGKQGSTGVVWGLIPALATVASLVCTATGSVFYKFDVVASVGQPIGPNLTSIGEFPSINDRGDVAFMGEDANGFLNYIFVGNGITAATNITPSFGLTATADFSNAVQINNAEQVISQDNSSPNVTKIRIWNSIVPDTTTVIATGQFGSPGLFDFAAVFSHPSLNDADEPVFFGLDHDTSSTYLLRPGICNFPSDNFCGYTAGGNVLTGIRPLIADNGRTVLRMGGGPISFAAPIKVWNSDLSTDDEIASMAMGFTRLGRMPGISDDGTVVAFAADRGNGRGIFLSFLGAGGIFEFPTPIAGENPGPSFNTELGNDAGSPRYLTFNDIELDSRVAVIRTELGAPGFVDDSIVVCFLATPNAASRDNPALPGTPLFFTDQPGLWTIRVDMDLNLEGGDPDPYPHVVGPLPVVQVGDKIGTKEIQSIELYDPLARATRTDNGVLRDERRGDHRIAFWASTDEDDVVVRASRLDSDEDGLLDHWEIDGIDVDRDGAVDLSLAQMGADPMHRDLFVEIDWHADWTGDRPHTHKPHPGVVSLLEDMYAQAPALPNGINAGITLHLDAGLGTDSLGQPLSLNMGSGVLRGGDEIAHADIVHWGQPGSIEFPPLPGGGGAPGLGETRSLYDIKENFFGNGTKDARQLAFHYVFLGDFYGFFPDSDNPFTGNVTAADQTSFTSDTVFPVTPAKRASVMITSGTGAGQIREIKDWDGAMIGDIDPAWTVVPDSSSTFVLLNANAAAAAEMGTYPDPDFNTLPGDDTIVTLRGWGISTYLFNNQFEYYLSTPFNLWTTVAHELGHNLGLRHCGTNGSAAVCSGTPCLYLSLMSYAHNLLNPVCPVMSYAGVGDPTFEDWLHLKMDFQSDLRLLGSTLAVAGSPEEMTPADQIALGGDPFDLDGPVVTIDSPAPGAPVGVGDDVTVTVTVTDIFPVDPVTVSFDLDGDGIADGPGETVDAAAIGADLFEATFFNVSGPDGERTITAVAYDPSLNPGSAETTVNIGGFTAGDLDGDGVVGILDFLALLAVWGQCPDPCPPLCPGDIDGDCNVGISDFLLLLANWG